MEKVQESEGGEKGEMGCLVAIVQGCQVSPTFKKGEKEGERTCSFS